MKKKTEHFTLQGTAYAQWAKNSSNIRFYPL